MEEVQTTTLISLPTDVIRSVFTLLDDNDLLSLRHVSMLTRIIGLVVILTSDRSRINPGCDAHFSSSNAVELERNLKLITKLTCHFTKPADWRLCRAILLTLPNISEVVSEDSLHIWDTELVDGSSSWEVESYRRSSEKRRAISSFAYRYGIRAYASPTIMIIRDGKVTLSQRRRRPAGPLPFGHRNPLMSSFEHPLKRLQEASTSLQAIIRDPLTLRNQTERITADLCWDTLTNHVKSLPSLSSFFNRNWTLLIAGANITTVQHIGHHLSTRRWCLVLPHIHLPVLESLHICKNTGLPMADFLNFCSRHHTIKALSLEPYSLSGVRAMTAHQGRPPLPCLESLEAPLHYIETFFRVIDLSLLSAVSVGKRPRPKYLKGGPFFFRRNAIERKFDFKTLDNILQALSTSNVSSLTLVIPGGRKSAAWLRGAAGAVEGAERKLGSVRKVTVLSERDESFHPDVVVSFPSWLKLFPSVRKFNCRAFPWPLSFKDMDDHPAHIETFTQHNLEFPTHYHYFWGDFHWADCVLCGDFHVEIDWPLLFSVF